MNNLDEKRVLFSLTELALNEAGITDEILYEAESEFLELYGRSDPYLCEEFIRQSVHVGSRNIEEILTPNIKAWEKYGWNNPLCHKLTVAGEFYELLMEHIDVGNLNVTKKEELDHYISRKDYTEWYGTFWEPKDKAPIVGINEDIQKLLDGTHEKQAPELKIALEVWLKAIKEPIKNTANISAHIAPFLPEGLTDRARNRITPVVNWNKSGGR